MLAHKKQQIKDALLDSSERHDNYSDPTGNIGPPFNGSKASYHRPNQESSFANEGGQSSKDQKDGQKSQNPRNDIPIEDIVKRGLYTKVDLISDKFEAYVAQELNIFRSDESKVTVSEPRNFMEKCTAILQNMFEIIVVQLVVIIGRSRPSYYSFWVSIITYMSLIPTVMNQESRVKAGIFFSVINMAFMGLLILAKIKYGPGENLLAEWSQSGSSGSNENAALDGMIDYQSFGYVFVKDEKKGYTHNLQTSLQFETAAFIIFAIQVTFFLVMQCKITSLKSTQNQKVAMLLHHWTFSASKSQGMDDEDDTEEQMKEIHIGTGKTKGQKKLNEKKVKEEFERVYQIDLHKMAKSAPRCYIDCFYFSKLNKSLFLLSFAFTMLQAMAFNCLFELPQLFMMLVFFSLYAERSKMQIGFSIYILAFMSVLCISLFITIAYGTYIHTATPMKWYIDNIDSNKTVQVMNALFGSRVKLPNEDHKLKQSDKWAHRISFLVSFCCTHAWMIAKWSSVREQTRVVSQGTMGIWQKWRFAHENKELIRTYKQIVEQIVKILRSQKVQKQNGENEDQDDGGAIDQFENVVKNFNVKSLSRIAKSDLISSLKNDFIYFMPSVTIWVLRLGFGYQAYLYHSNIGLFHLSYVLATFFFSRKFSYFMTIYIILPIYSIEFIVIYGMGIPGIQNLEFFKMGQYLTPVTREEMEKHGTMLWEQALYFFNLSMLFLSISCYRIVYLLQQKEAKGKGIELKASEFTQDGSDTVTLYILKKLKSPYSNTIWKVSFYIFRYIHVIMLFALLCEAAPDLNHFRALGFMVLFAFWTISEKLYRKTVKILIFFMSFFIVNQYYYSLTYKRFIDDEQQKENLKFYNMIDKLHEWKKEDPIYFRFKPYLYDWMILIMTSGLISINKIFLDKKQAEKIQSIVFEELEKRHQKVVYYFMLVQIKLRGILVFILQFSLFYFIGKVQTNIINIVFFSLIMTLIMVVSKNDNKQSTLKWSKRLAQAILTYSMVILVTEFIFAITLGYREKPEYSTSVDANFKAKHPWIYSHFEFIGFRMAEEKSELPYAKQVYLDYFRLKFSSYIAFMLVSNFTLSHFQEQVKKQKNKLKMKEEQWTYLLEFVQPTLEQLKQNKLNELVEHKQRLETYDSTLFQKQSTIIKQDVDEMGDDYIIHNSKERLDSKYLKRFWINIQDDPAYNAFKLLNYWPFLDFISTYSHLFTNLIIIYVVIQVKITVYSLFLLGCICLFYILVTQRISNRSMEIYKESGLLEQTELKIAGLIAKKYAQKSTREFLQLRSKFWKYQTIIYVIIISISFCTTLSFRYRDQLNYEYQAADLVGQDRVNIFEKIKFADKLQFYLFFFGLYKDHRKVEQNYFYGPFLAIGMAFIIERQAINWLLNRQGCNFNVFQKITEIEQRVILIDEGLDAPPYDPQRYKNHYFFPDFDLLLDRMTEDVQTSKVKTKKAKKNMSENREFLPHKIANRLKHTIEFSINLDSIHVNQLDKTDKHLSKDAENSDKIQFEILKQQCDDQTKDMLNEYGEFCKKHGHFVPMHDFKYDYETYPVLRNHKIGQLEMILKSYVDRKYKISFMKGMMMVMEQTILLLTLMTMILKANMYSFIYLIFVVKYFFCQSKVFLIVRMNVYIAIMFMIQYTTFLFNLTSGTSPQPFPKKLENYPHIYGNEDNNAIPYAIPFFYKFSQFRDLNMSYFLGIGVQNHQIEVLFIDFINLAIISMYIFNFRNPLLFRSMKKVFWQYPNDYDSISKWKRLEPQVLKQSKWFKNQYKITHEKYKPIKYTDEERELAKIQTLFAKEYQNIYVKGDNSDDDNLKDEDVFIGEEHFKSNSFAYQTDVVHEHSEFQDNQKKGHSHGDKKGHSHGDEKGHSHGDKKESKDHGHNTETVYDNSTLNYMLVNWIELKFDQVWSSDFVREKKWELKEQSFYFRAVKQGSVLLYLTMHIFLMFIIMIMATVRRSIISFGYIIIILPRMKDGSEVLKQRDSNQDKIRQEAKDKIDVLKEQLKKEYGTDESQMMIKMKSQLESKVKDKLSDDHELNMKNYFDQQMKDSQDDQPKQKVSQARIFQLKSQIKDAEDKLRKIEQKRGPRTKLQQAKEASKTVSEQWVMIEVVKKYLLYFAMIDLLMQLYVQMPFIYNSPLERKLGIRKVWLHPLRELNSVKHKYYGYDYAIAINKGNERLFEGLTLNVLNFNMQIAIGVMICLISLQAEIFDSEGYKKYVTQTDGSMDLIIQLATEKQKSLTYVYNNWKIQKILRNQNKREVIINTVAKFKEKLIRWRKFQRTTLDPLESKTPTRSRQTSQTTQEKSASKPPTPKSEQATPKQQKTETKVKFSKEIEEHKAVEDIDKDEDGLLDMVDQQKKKSIPPEILEGLYDKLAAEFVKSKENKLGRCASCYLCLQRSCVIQILFKNQKDDLESIVQQQAMGKMMTVPCELEKVMIIETKEIIRNRYDHIDGVTELWKLLNSSKGKSGESLLKMTQLDQKIKLKQMPNTWRFTRHSSLLFKYIETLFYSLISNTHNIIYLSMMASMYQSAGLVSLVYPISIFGYALLEETRPRQQYWNRIRTYTIVMLSIKFFINLKLLDDYTSEPTDPDVEESKIGQVFEHWNGLLMIGLRKANDDITSILQYLLPEMMIITFIMLNQIKLKLIGLFDKQEEDFENVKEGIQRYIYQGDIEKVQEDKIKRTYMNMSTHFRSLKDQQDDEIQMFIEKQKAENEKLKNPLLNDDDESHQQKDVEPQLLEKQNSILSGLSRQIFLCATEFDIDNTGDIISDLDMQVKRKLIKKGLENDSLYFVEGAYKQNHPDFINEENFEKELIKLTLEQKAFSSGDFKEEVEEIQKMIDSQNEEQQQGVFEKNAYLKRIFPASIEQKPGVDYYGTTTLILFIIAIYVCNYFDKLFVTPEDLLQGAKDSNNIFSGKLSLILLFISIVIVLERFISRADVRIKVKDNSLDLEEKSFFSKQQMFARSTTERSMTVKLKTMKTSDLDFTSADSQEFLSSFTDMKDTRGPSTNTTKVSKQQKLKFYLHWFVLIASHTFIFYFIPLIGNSELYGWDEGPKCNDDQKEKYKYGCKNFHSMWQSQLFYTLICWYLYISAKQMRKGLSTFKITSSLMCDYEWYYNIRMIVYMMIPFAAELRCLCDFAFTRTSLDVFQYWQLFNYHVELYQAKLGNDSYVVKIFGAEVEFMDYLIGYLILGILLIVLIGPIVFFSEYAFIQANPVKEAEISVALVISKSLTKNDLVTRSVWNWEKAQNQQQNEKARITDELFMDAINNDSLHMFDMAYENSYIHHEDEEIDLDIIFGRKDHRSKPLKLKQKSSKKMFGGGESTNLIDANGEDKGKLLTEVPYVVFKVSDPNMRSINDNYHQQMNYSNWTETKFFQTDQIQEVITTEYPDSSWTIDYYNRKFLMEDIDNSFEKKLEKTPGYDIKLLIETKFVRDNPTDAKQAVGTQSKILNMDRADDCATMMQLESFAQLDCDKDPQGSQQILYQQAYQPLLILGAKKDVFTVTRNVSDYKQTDPEIIKHNQMYDLLLEFRCPDIWLVRAAKLPTIVLQDQLKNMKVDPSNQCKNVDDEQGDKAAGGKTKQDMNSDEFRSMFTRFNFTLFSMFVSGSFLAGYSVKSFYMLVAYGTSGMVRTAFIFGTWKGFVYEITDSMALIKIFEAVYMYRFEQDLYNEEECYRMIQEIIRSPDLLKALTGSSLRGQLDPQLDKFTDEDKKKYRHLERLEARGKFDVAKLKQDILDNYKDK